MSDKIDWLREAVEAVENVVRERDSRIRQLDQRAGELQALVAVYAEYVALLESSLADLHGTHGYRSPAAAVRRGAELRQRIEELSSAPADLDAPPLQSRIFRRGVGMEFEE
jgi:hypothetical protein